MSLYEDYMIWRSGLRVIEARKVEIRIHFTIDNVARTLEEKFPGLEWLFLANGYFERGAFLLGEAYHIPEQEVTSSEVSLLERIQRSEWNTVIHCHPWQGASFSLPDMECLNSYFLCSRLRSRSSWEKGSLLFSPKDSEALVFLEIPRERIRVYYPPLEVEGLDKIQPKRDKMPEISFSLLDVRRRRRREFLEYEKNRDSRWQE